MFEGLDKLLARLEAAMQRAKDERRTGERADLAMRAEAAILREIAKSPVLGQLAQAARSVVRQTLNDDTFSPCAAAGPARELLAVLDDLLRAGDELLALEHDRRFSARLRPFHEIGLPNRVPASEFVERMAYLTGLLLSTARHTNHALETLVRANDPRQVVLGEQTPVDLPALDLEHQTIPPRAPSKYRSEAAKVRDLRMRSIVLGRRLRDAARRGQSRLNGASLTGGKAFGPDAVSGEALAITVLIAETLKHAAELSSQAYVSTDKHDPDTQVS